MPALLFVPRPPDSWVTSLPASNLPYVCRVSSVFTMAVLNVLGYRSLPVYPGFCDHRSPGEVGLAVEWL